MSRAYLGGNIGLGLDIGGTYQLNNDFSVTASILDIGAIFHSRHTEKSSARGDYTLDGIELIFPDVENGDMALPYYENFEEEFERSIPRDTARTSYVQMRPAKFNAGLHYDFGRPSGLDGYCNCLVGRGFNQRRSQVGAQYYAILRPKGPQMAGTLYYRRNFDEGFSVKATYTVDSFSATNIGLGIAINKDGGNFFIAKDNLLYYSNIAKAKSLSIQLGFAIIMD
jgi:hypothetical protein